MAASHTPNNKPVSLLLVACLMVAFNAMALDQHLRGASPLCPICHAKLCLNGVEESFILDPYPQIAFYPELENSHSSAFFNFPFSQSRAPPRVISY